MKAQIEDSRLRLRVSRAEFDQLCAGGVLGLELAWPGQRWRLSLAAGTQLGVAARPEGVGLTLPTEDLHALAARLPSREGLAYRLALPDGAVELHFEVDIRDRHARTR